jgi:hypothetical protein
MDAAVSGQRWPDARTRMLRAVGCPLGSFAQQNSLAGRIDRSACLERGGDFPRLYDDSVSLTKAVRHNDTLFLGKREIG